MTGEEWVKKVGRIFEPVSDSGQSVTLRMVGDEIISNKLTLTCEKHTVRAPVLRK